MEKEKYDAFFKNVTELDCILSSYINSTNCILAEGKANLLSDELNYIISKDGKRILSIKINDFSKIIDKKDIVLKEFFSLLSIINKQTINVYFDVSTESTRVTVFKPIINYYMDSKVVICIEFFDDNSYYILNNIKLAFEDFLSIK